MTGPMPQAERALRLANEVRIAGAAERRRIRALPAVESADALANALANLGSPLGVLDAAAALQAARGVGPTRATAWLRAAGVERPRRLRDLTTRQRIVLAGLVREAVVWR